MSWDYVEHFATKAEYNGPEENRYILSTRNNETHRDDNNNNSLMSISWSLDEL